MIAAADKPAPAEARRFGPVEVIPGEWYEPWRLFHATSLHVDDGAGALIDLGGALDRLLALRDSGRVAVTIVSHAHGDHLWHAPKFKGRAEMWAPAGERDAFSADADTVIDHFGVRGTPAEKPWRQRVARGDTAYAGTVHRWLEPGERIVFGDTAIEMVHTPGHTSGCLAAYFPREKICAVHDFDLTKFGPWYGQTAADIDEFRASALKLLTLDCDWYVTGHEEGTVDHAEFERRVLPWFDDAVIRRDGRVLDTCREHPRDFMEIARGGVAYKNWIWEQDNPFLQSWEMGFARKHIARLVKLGALVEVEPARWRTA